MMQMALVGFIVMAGAMCFVQAQPYNDGGYFVVSGAFQVAIVDNNLPSVNFTVLRTTVDPSSDSLEFDAPVLGVAYLSDSPIMNNTNPFNRTDLWPQLSITPDRDLLYEHPTQAYYVTGYLEGYSNFFDIYNIWQSCVDPLVVKTFQKTWVKQHLAYLQSLAQPWCTDLALMVCDFEKPFGGQLPSVTAVGAAKALSQFRGMVAGYQARAAAEDMRYLYLSEFQLFWLAFYEEVQAIFAANAPKIPNQREHPVRIDLPYLPPQAVTLLSLTADDLIIGHNTIDKWSRMVRLVKTYHLEVSVTMTATPGFWGSGDDLIVTSNGVVVVSTPLLTAAAFAPKRVTVAPQNTLLTTMRLLMVLTVALDASEVVGNLTAALPVSSTLPRQYVVIDLDEFSVVTATNASSGNLVLKSKAVQVIETIPGTVQSPIPTARTADLTTTLTSQKYWSCVGIPLFAATRSDLGLAQAADNCTYGGYYDIKMNPRQQIISRVFASPTTRPVSVPTMKTVMRQNDYVTDPLSVPPTCQEYAAGTPACYAVQCDIKQSPLLAIAPRGDLVSLFADDYGKLDDTLTTRSIGAIDSKVLSVRNLIDARRLDMSHPYSRSAAQFHLVLGPPWSKDPAKKLPTFDWYDAAPDVLILSHIGQPSHFVNYSFTPVNVTLLPAVVPQGAGNVSSAAKGKPTEGLLIAMIVSSGVIVVALFVSEMYQRQKQADKERKDQTAATFMAAAQSAAVADLQRRVSGATTNEKSSLLGRA